MKEIVDEALGSYLKGREIIPMKVRNGGGKMKKLAVILILVAMATVFGASPIMAQEGWYIPIKTGECKKVSEYLEDSKWLDEGEKFIVVLSQLRNRKINGPADLIEILRREREMKWRASDGRVVNGKPVVVEVTGFYPGNPLMAVEEFTLTFYRLESCREAIRKYKKDLKKENEHLEKYK